MLIRPEGTSLGALIEGTKAHVNSIPSKNQLGVQRDALIPMRGTVHPSWLF